jgi:hypothetical protein
MKVIDLFYVKLMVPFTENAFVIAQMGHTSPLSFLLCHLSIAPAMVVVAAANLPGGEGCATRFVDGAQ